MSSDDAEHLLTQTAHQLRNSLAPLIQGMQLLRNLGPGEPMASTTIDMMHRQLWELARLINALDRSAGKTSDPPAIIPVEAPAPTPQLRPVSWRRILVVDDNADAAQSLAALLRSMGPVVEIATDGWQALRLAAQFQPELVFMDIVMPELDGLQAARQLREQSWAKDLIICALTGSAGPHDQVRSSLAGIDYHLVKPVDPQALSAILSD